MTFSCAPFNPPSCQPCSFHLQFRSFSSPLLTPLRSFLTYFPIVGRNFQLWKLPPTAKYRLLSCSLGCLVISWFCSGVTESQQSLQYKGCRPLASKFGIIWATMSNVSFFNFSGTLYCDFSGCGGIVISLPEGSCTWFVKLRALTIFNIFEGSGGWISPDPVRQIQLQ